MARAIWKGTIQFGLVNIPVGLYPAEKTQELKFRMLDRRNLAPVQYKRVNPETGQEVPWDQIVKGYEYERDEFVLMGEADFKKARPEATQSVTIIEFVDAGQLHPIYFDKPYYLAPEKKARRSYTLLREALARSGKVGIARIVIHTREHLAALMVYQNALVVELMRFADELRPLEDYDLPGSAEQQGIGEKEIKMANRLIDDMLEGWRPERFKDQYRRDLLGFIRHKIETGQTHQVSAEEEAPAPAGPAEVVDMMELLKQSLRRRRAGEEPEQEERATGTEGGGKGGKTRRKRKK